MAGWILEGPSAASQLETQVVASSEARVDSGTWKGFFPMVVRFFR
jgi:hypothetical protein